jgi:RimJ/RimL family protein N-acetyltransferase
MIILETSRLILRTWEKQDIDSMTVINQDPKVCEFLPAIGNRASTEAGVHKIMQHYEEHGFCLYAVELKSTHEFIGWVGLAIPSFDAPFMPAVEIGWRLSSNHWNHGYATEAAKAVLDYAFNTLGLDEIVSFTAVNNQPSRRVMEKIGLLHHPEGDFDHPRLEKTHLLCRHVLYRLKNQGSH